MAKYNLENLQDIVKIEPDEITDIFGENKGNNINFEEELEKRKAETTIPPLYSRGVLGKYAHMVSSAAKGAVTDFWKPEETGKK